MEDSDAKHAVGNDLSYTHLSGISFLDQQMRSMDFKHENGHRYPNELHSMKLPDFVTENFLSSSAHSSQSELSPYSLRQNQLSIPYQYDVLLLYDPDDDILYLDNLLKYLAPQQLKIFDFNRDAPAGLPPQKVLQSTLKMCRYTCIMITQKFISNFWLQFRADMSIQDMLDNQEKLYSVIVIVMDRNVTKSDLPLDLMTLSPLFIGDRYFEDKIKRTFSKERPFPHSVHTTSSFLKQPLPISQLPPSYNDVTSAGISLGNDPIRKHSLDLKHSQQSGDYGQFPTGHTDLTNMRRADLSMMSEVGTTSSLGPSSRLPTEHGDSAYLMPPSLFGSYGSELSTQPSLPHVVRRGESVTVHSTGSRQPRELLETGSIDNTSSILSNKVMTCEPSDNSSEGNTNINAMSSSHNAAEVFSFHNCTDGASNHGMGTLQRDFEHPAFFSINTANSVQSGYSEYSELEISELSELHLTTTEQKEDQLDSHGDGYGSYSSTLSQAGSPRFADDISYRSLPAPVPHDVTDESLLPRCSSVGQNAVSVVSKKKLCHLTDNTSCSSLPERAAIEISNDSTPKRSFSMRSLFGLRKIKLGKVLRGKK